jgi:hypothetical protein
VEASEQSGFLNDFKLLFRSVDWVDEFDDAFITHGELAERNVLFVGFRESIAEAIENSRRLSETANWSHRQRAAITELAEWLAGSPDAARRAQSRPILESLSEMWTGAPGDREEIAARCALIHMRAGDSTLAAARLRQLPIDLDGFSIDSAVATDEMIGWFRTLLLHRQVLGGLGDIDGLQQFDDVVATAFEHVLMNHGVAAIDGIVWSAIVPAHAGEEIGAARMLRERLGDFVSGPDVELALVTLATAIIQCPLPRDLADGHAAFLNSALDQAEEILWLTGSLSRSEWWALLASAASSARDVARAERYLRQALDEFDPARSQVGPSPSMLIDLLEARVRIDQLEGVSQTDSAADRPVVGVDPGEAGPRTSIEPSLPELPSRLVDELMAGDFVLVAGPELPEVRGAPGRRGVIERLVGELASQGTVGEGAAVELVEQLRRGEAARATRLLRASFPDLGARIAAMYDAPSTSPTYEFLGQMGPAHIVSMSWDHQIVRAFEHLDPYELHAGSDDVSKMARSGACTFTWFAGRPEHEQLALDVGDLRRRFYSAETLGRFVSGLAQSSTLVFIGATISDLDDFFEALPPSSEPMRRDGEPRHYALGERGELFELDRQQLRDTRGVELIGVDPSIDDGMSRMMAELTFAARPVDGFDVRAAHRASAAPRLDRILLENVGVFERLDVALAGGWNLMLGNNGCGKSTVLRAVALGLCGDHPSAAGAGESLLRVGAQNGSIELFVGPTRYRTELSRSGDAVFVRTASLTPVQEGHWAVLGFPALRGTSLTSPTGIAHPASAGPDVSDLIPLLHDDVDNRLDDIKQWIINIESRSQDPDGRRWKQLLDRFFAILRELTPGMQLEFAGVDRSSWSVSVRTVDGVISIDQLSQGMSSIIAWVGTVLQRLYDIHPESDEPAHEPAFVLIDELDAHLHPAWQRVLASLARRHFPHVQFLATSHSPLIAGGLESGELFVARRLRMEDADGTDVLTATIEPIAMDVSHMRADQILTSPLFGLMSSRSREAETDINRYSELLGMDERSPQDEREFQRLRAALVDGLAVGETAEERASEAAEAAQVSSTFEELKQLDPEVLQALGSDDGGESWTDPPQGRST